MVAMPVVRPDDQTAGNESDPEAEESLSSSHDAPENCLVNQDLNHNSHDNSHDNSLDRADSPVVPNAPSPKHQIDEKSDESQPEIV